MNDFEKELIRRKINWIKLSTVEIEKYREIIEKEQNSIDELRNEIKEIKGNNSKVKNEENYVFLGVFKEDGKIVEKENAFDYAINKMANASEKEKEEFIEWFFSGNWLKINIEEGV